MSFIGKNAIELGGDKMEEKIETIEGREARIDKKKRSVVVNSDPMTLNGDLVKVTKEGLEQGIRELHIFCVKKSQTLYKEGVLFKVKVRNMDLSYKGYTERVYVFYTSKDARTMIRANKLHWKVKEAK